MIPTWWRNMTSYYDIMARMHLRWFYSECPSYNILYDMFENDIFIATKVEAETRFII